MSTELEVVQDTTTVTSSDVVEVVDSTVTSNEVSSDIDVVIEENNFVITSGGMYGSNSGPTTVPDWLQTAINNAIGDGYSVQALDQLINDLNNAISSLEDGVNQNISRIVTNRETINTLDTYVKSTVDGNIAAILNTQQTLASKDYTQSSISTYMASMFNGQNSSANSWALDATSTYADSIGAIASEMTTLGATVTNPYTGLAATAYNVHTINNVVGITDGVVDGTGLLQDISMLQSQMDGTIEAYMGEVDILTYDVDDDGVPLVDTVEILDVYKDDGVYVTTATSTSTLDLHTLWYKLDVAEAKRQLATYQMFTVDGVSVDLTYNLDTDTYTDSISGIVYTLNTVYDDTTSTWALDVTDTDTDTTTTYDVDSAICTSSNGTWELTHNTRGDCDCYFETNRANHIGDIYIYHTRDASTGQWVYEKSYKYMKTVVDTTTPLGTDPDGYTWALVTDSAANNAYMLASEAAAMADGKSAIHYGTLEERDTLSLSWDSIQANRNIGDVWYVPTTQIDGTTTVVGYRWSGSVWEQLADEAQYGLSQVVDTVTAQLDGVGEGTGSVVNYVQASSTGVESKWAYNSELSINGVTYSSGFGLQMNAAATDNGEAGSEFWVDANKFRFTDGSVGHDVFVADANGVEFTGKVNFYGLGLDSTSTSINGGLIDANTITADTIVAGSSFTSPIINGGTISGGLIEGVNIVGAVIKSSWIDYTSSGSLTNWQHYTTSSVPSSYKANFAHDNETGALVVDSDGYVRLPGILNVAATGGTQSYKGADSHSFSLRDNIHPYNSYAQSSTNRVISAKPTVTVLSSFKLMNISDNLGTGNSVDVYWYINGTKVRVVVSSYPSIGNLLEVGGATKYVNKDDTYTRDFTYTTTVEGISITFKAWSSSNNPWYASVTANAGTHIASKVFSGSSASHYVGGFVSSYASVKATVGLGSYKLN